MNSDTLPARASVVVIGGGVMGCSTLYHLAKAGVSDAVLLERNQLTSGTTWHSAAQVRALRSSKNLTDLIKYSVSLYQSLEAETGQSTGWINKGSLSIATNADRLTFIKRQEALAHLYGVKANSISTAEALERWPMMNADDVIGAVWSPDDGRVGPSDLCAALVKGAKAKGAQIFENTGVTGIKTRDNRVVGVVTSAGEIACDAIALCSGLWSRENAAMAGVDVPVWPCEHFYLLTNPIEGISGNLPTLSDHDSHLYIRDDSGGLLVGCFEPVGKPIDPKTIGEDFAFQLLDEDWDHFEPMLNNALHRLPCLADAELRMLLNGPESFTPDGSFLLGESAETDGFYLGCGMNSVGVATGGGAGMALAHCIMHGHTPTDLSEADPKRYPGCWNSVASLSARVPEILGTHYAIHYPGYQNQSARNLRHTPLHSQWQARQACFGQFYGWERPLYFGCEQPPRLSFDKPEWFDRVGAEVEQAHQHAAVFDLSSFGKIQVRGDDAATFLNRVCANNMLRPIGAAIYTAMLNQRGCFESDLTALRLGQNDYRLYVGSNAVKRDLAWLRRQQLPEEQIHLIDQTEAFAVLALMGPESFDIIDQLGGGDIARLGYFRHCRGQLAGIDIEAVRLSYVGEAGVELSCRSSDAERLWLALGDAGVKPAGLFAQASMRIEKRFLSFGHDLDSDINPLQAGLDFAIDWESDFIGKSALIETRLQQPTSCLASILLDDIEALPLGGEPVYENDRIIGKTTSAAFGYRVGRPVAIALINRQPAQLREGLEVEIDIARRKYSGRITHAPAFDPDGNRMRQRI
ncbi:MAG: glycine cleavage system aminomethyltransferase T/glycine [Gammaproteobacteria bacterium]|jgi:glycine cleavage system aminomethyltransferase T/glycine/D-amino acid oxidase-like deaminating enzyme